MNAPLVLGIAGGTGSGKTSVSNAIRNALPAGSVTSIDHDSYYRDHSDLSVEERAKINFDHPDSLETSLLVKHLDELRAGRGINKPIYDFKTHARRPETIRVEVAPVLIVEGILVLQDEELRARMDVKLFVDTDADVRIIRRIRRDMEERGRSFSEIRDQYYATVRPMHEQFVQPSRRFADIIIPEGGRNAVAIGVVVQSLLRFTEHGLPAPR